MKDIKKIIVIIFIIAITFILKSPLHAQSCAPGVNPLAVGGLISAPRASSGYGGDSSNVCILDPKAAFAPFKIPLFKELKSLYFDQAKSTSSVNKHSPINGSATNTDIPFNDSPFHPYHLYDIKGDLTISTSNTSGGSGIVFVEGNLNFTGSYCYAVGCGSATTAPLTGTVFVVAGNVNISTAVTRIDAVIISAGTICTAADSSNPPQCLPNVPSQPLVINGSLISLTNTAPIKFNRTLSNNSQPSEKINHQIKYLVILRNTLVLTLQKWSELSVPYTPVPTPTITPQPSPTLTPSPTATAPSPTATPGPTSTPTPTPPAKGGCTNVNVAKDADQDGYIVGTASTQCLGTPTTINGRTYYPDGFGAYTWLLSSQSLGTDCYDSNANAYPGQTAWFTTNRGDGSFDYDCNGLEDKQYPNTSTIPTVCTNTFPGATNGPGFVSGPPAGVACGVSGTFNSNCQNNDALDCSGANYPISGGFCATSAGGQAKIFFSSWSGFTYNTTQTCH